MDIEIRNRFENFTQSAKLKSVWRYVKHNFDEEFIHVMEDNNIINEVPIDVVNVPRYSERRTL